MLRQAIVDGAYWLRPPGPNCQLVVAYTGAVAPEAIQAVGLMADSGVEIAVNPIEMPVIEFGERPWIECLGAADDGVVGRLQIAYSI